MDKYIAYILMEYEKKLYQLMGKEAYVAFMKKTTKEAFRLEIGGMAEGDFKDFVLENFDMITGDDDVDEIPDK